MAATQFEDQCTDAAIMVVAWIAEEAEGLIEEVAVDSSGTIVGRWVPGPRDDDLVPDDREYRMEDVVAVLATVSVSRGIFGGRKGKQRWIERRRS